MFFWVRDLIRYVFLGGVRELSRAGAQGPVQSFSSEKPGKSASSSLNETSLKLKAKLDLFVDNNGVSRPGHNVKTEDLKEIMKLFSSLAENLNSEGTSSSSLNSSNTAVGMLADRATIDNSADNIGDQQAGLSIMKKRIEGLFDKKSNQVSFSSYFRSKSGSAKKIAKLQVIKMNFSKQCSIGKMGGSTGSLKSGTVANVSIEKDDITSRKWAQKRYTNSLSEMSKSLNITPDSILPVVNSNPKLEKFGMKANLIIGLIHGEKPDSRQAYKLLVETFRETVKVADGLEAMTFNTDEEKESFNKINDFLNQLATSFYSGVDANDITKTLVESTREVSRERNEESLDVSSSSDSVQEVIGSDGMSTIGGLTILSEGHDSVQVSEGQTKGDVLLSELEAAFDEIKPMDKVLNTAGGEGLGSVFGTLAPKIGGLLAGEIGINYDPNMQGNTPYKAHVLPERLGEDGKGVRKAVQFIRMGTPTMQAEGLSGTAANVNPEFKQFLKAKKGADGKVKGHHVYFNRQKRNGPEGTRSTALENLQHDSKFKDVFTCVTLPADGSWYSQKSSESALSRLGVGITNVFSGVSSVDNDSEEQQFTVKGFKDEIADLMFNNKQGFYIPDKFKQPNEAEFKEKMG